LAKAAGMTVEEAIALNKAAHASSKAPGNTVEQVTPDKTLSPELAKLLEAQIGSKPALNVFCMLCAGEWGTVKQSTRHLSALVPQKDRWWYDVASSYRVRDFETLKAAFDAAADLVEDKPSASPKEVSDAMKAVFEGDGESKQFKKFAAIGHEVSNRVIAAERRPG
jgi:hypothetical protein